MQQVRHAAAASLGLTLISWRPPPRRRSRARASTDAEAAAVSAALDVELVCSVVAVSTVSNRCARWDIDRDACTSEGTDS
jgi:hypothetical protein